MTARGRRLLALPGLVAASFAALALAGASPASAHPLGNFTVNRYSGLLLTPGRVAVTYVVDMAEIPTAQEMPQIDRDGDGQASPAERQAWADGAMPGILARISLTVGGSLVALRVDGAAMAFRGGQAGLPILRLVATLTGVLPRSGDVGYQDHNYADRIGWKEITVRSANGVAVSGSTVPAASVSRELLAYPVQLLTSPLDVTSASFTFRPGTATDPTGPTVGGPTVSGAPVSSGAGFADLARRELTPIVLVVALALAFLFGAVHALLPGHGKTITAAYLVGSGARRRTAVVAGVAVATMHTVSVLVLGVITLVVFRSVHGESIIPWLTLLTGLVALALGGWLFVQRLRARRAGQDPWLVHAHGTGAHRHDPPQDQDDPAVSHVVSVAQPSRQLVLVGAPGIGGPRATFVERPGHVTGNGHAHANDHPHDHHDHGPEGLGSRTGLMALAVAGGILPSPTAIVVLTSAITYHRIAYGLALIAAFSLGLASALILVGTVALGARSLLARRMKSRLAGLLPLASAVVIVGFGLFFTARGLFQVG